MTILLPAVAVAFAFCVWLTVRIVNRRERWAKRTLAAAVGLPILYVVSFGPACWLADRDLISGEIVDSAFQPLATCCIYSGSTVINSALWYGELLPTPQPYFNDSPFGHSNWRMPKAHELMLHAIAQKIHAEPS